MPEDENEHASGDAEAPPGRSKKWLWMGVASLLAVVAAGGVYYWSTLTDAAVAEAAEPIEEPEPAPAMPGGIVTLNPFTVNLSDTESSRFLRTTIELGVPTSEDASRLASDVVRQARARAAILDVLTQQRASDLVTPEGKALAKQAIKKAAEQAMAPVEIMDVLFTDFVIQF